ncbi:MAG: TauD/TfdA family dioxygenase [Ilumatobacteraceae bacterium]
MNTLLAAHVDGTGPGSTVTLRWSDGGTSRLLSLWLRDNAPELLHATTHHRVVETSTIPDDVHPGECTVVDGDLHLTWAHDDHRSVFPAAWLREHDYSGGARYVDAAPTLWDASAVDDIPRASWPELLADEQLRSRFLHGFCAHGLALLHDVPNEPGTVLEVAAELGEVRTTSWGTLFDVVSMIDANSVAYTNLPLVVHTDEGYRDPAPTIQLQHFLRSDTSGGAATLTDGFKVAADLRATRPDLFQLLVEHTLHFHFSDANAEHAASGPVISLTPEGELRAIRYSNHSVRPFLLPADVMAQYYEAYRTFGRMRESEQYQLRIEMGAGEMYIVDNRRVMHGRTGFSGGGARHLQSCYIERDELVSRLTVLDRRLQASGR